MSKKIVYVTQVYYLDASLEIIKQLSKEYALDVIIELTRDSSRANVFDLTIDLEKYDKLVEFRTVVIEWGLESFEPYFTKCLSVNFLLFNNKRSISWNSISISQVLSKFLEKSNADYYHFDDYSLRLASLLPYLFRNREKLVLNVHDPLPHLGESDFKKNILKKIVFRLFKKHVVFSSWSKILLEQQLSKKQKVFQLPLLPYTIYQNFLEPLNPNDSKKITFVGRISKYKGVELFVNSIEITNFKYSNEEYCIAGKPVGNYRIPINATKINNIKFVLKHLSIKELTNIISQSKVIVCPYIESTQSGVIMTAYALGKPVIVTNVGGLPEYVNFNTGQISEPDSAALSKAIEAFIENPLYSEFSVGIKAFSEALEIKFLNGVRNIYIK